MARLLTLDAAGRRRWFLIWQLPVVFLVGLLVLAMSITASDLLARPVVVGGLVAVLVVSVVGLRLPVTRLSSLLPVVPVVDIAAIAAIRSEAVDVLISSSAVALVPIICLGFHFGRAGVVTGVGGAVVTTSLPFVRDRAVPQETEWIGLLALPTVSAVLAVMAMIGSTMLADRSKRLGEALRAANDQLALTRSLIEVLPVGLDYRGPDGASRIANRRVLEFARLAGVDISDPASAGSAVWREDRISRIPAEEQYIPRALSGAVIEAELCWIGEPGEQVAVLVSAHPLISSAGERTGTVIVSQDVTALVESVRVRDQFLSTLSHELRTPLVSVVGYLDIISAELEDAGPEILDMLSTARRGARTLTDRISQLLVAGAQDRLTLELDRVDLGALVGTVTESYRSDAAERGVTLTCTTGPLVTTADPHKIELMIDNLVSNALKHSGSGGTVAVSLRSRTDIELTVSDTGSGLARHESDRVFEPFYRTESAQYDAIQGLGLGLSICKAVVEAHGGTIDLETRAGRGTTVTVRLPARSG